MKELPKEIQFELENAKRLSKSKVSKSPSKYNHYNKNNGMSSSTRNKSPNKNVSKSPNSISTNVKKGRGRPRKIDKIMDNTKYGSIFDTMNTTKLLKSTVAATSHVHSSKTNKNNDVESSKLISKCFVQTKQPNTVRQKEAVDGPGFLSPNKVDVDVLNELPPDIRNQIWSDLKKTSVNFKSKLPQTNPSSTTTNTPTVPTISSNIDDIVSPSQLDASFLKAIPADMRSEIIEESKKVKRRKLLHLDSNKQDVSTGNSYLESTCIRSTLLKPFPPVVKGIDQSLLETLLGSVRDEILNAPKHKQASKLSVSDNFSVQKNPVTCTSKLYVPHITDNIEMLLEKEDGLPNEVKLVQVIPEFYGASSCKEVKCLFRKWLNEGKYYLLRESIITLSIQPHYPFFNLIILSSTSLPFLQHHYPFFTIITLSSTSLSFLQPHYPCLLYTSPSPRDS